MVYHKTKLNLSNKDVHDLVNGRPVKISSTQHNKGHDIHVTTSQLKRMKKSGISGRAINLLLKPAQVKKNVKMGGNVFSDAWNLFKHGATKGIDSLASIAQNPDAQKLGLAALTKLLAGAGQKRKSKSCKAKCGGSVRPQMYNDDVYDTGAYTIRGDKVSASSDKIMDGSGPMGDFFNSMNVLGLGTKRKRTKKGGAVRPQPYNDDVYDTGANTIRGTRVGSGKKHKRGKGPLGDFFNSMNVLGLGTKRKRTKRGSSFRPVGGSFSPVGGSFTPI